MQPNSSAVWITLSEKILASMVCTPYFLITDDSVTAAL